MRRIVAIFVKKGEAREWSAEKGAWMTLDPESTLTDPTLARPLRVKELLDAAEADNSVARALLTKNNPVLAQSLAEAEKKGLWQAVEIACELLGIELTEERRSYVNGLDTDGIEALLAHLRTARRFP